MEEIISQIDADTYHFIEQTLTKFKLREIGYDKAIRSIQNKYEEEIVKFFN